MLQCYKAPKKKYIQMIFLDYFHSRKHIWLYLHFFPVTKDIYRLV